MFGYSYSVAIAVVVVLVFLVSLFFFIRESTARRRGRESSAIRIAISLGALFLAISFSIWSVQEMDLALELVEITKQALSIIGASLVASGIVLILPAKAMRHIGDWVAERRARRSSTY